MKIIDNKVEKLGDNLKDKIHNGADLEVCASIFSMYGYKYLKKELENLDSFKFIFTDPAFIQKSNDDKVSREFEINSNTREKSIFGSEFEVKLKNELNGEGIAKECAKWVRRKAKFKSNVSSNYIQRFINVKNKNNEQTSFINTDKFDSTGLGYSKDNSIFSTIQEYDDYESTKYFVSSFNDLWNNQKELIEVTDDVVNYLNDLYKENSPEFIYYITLYNIFHEFLQDVSEDELANEKTGFKESKIWNTLYDFQKDAGPFPYNYKTQTSGNPPCFYGRNSVKRTSARPVKVPSCRVYELLCLLYKRKKVSQRRRKRNLWLQQGMASSQGCKQTSL